MERNCRVIPIIMILLSLLLIAVSTPSCQANYANWGILHEGSSFHNGTHIRMPYADVRINITYTLSKIDVILDSEFHIKTNTTQNATLAYVYPSHGSDTGFLNESLSMLIYANETMINYTIIHYDDLIESGFPDDFIQSYGFVLAGFVDFAVFDIELIANTTMVFSTQSEVAFDSNMDRFEYSYIVGSARTFEGDTSERVHMRVFEEQLFSSKSFYPNESLSVVENGTMNAFISDAIWDFNIYEFSSEVVGFTALISGQGITWTSVIGSVGVAAIIILLVYHFGYKKSKEFN